MLPCFWPNRKMCMMRLNLVWEKKQRAYSVRRAAQVEFNALLSNQ